MRLFVELLRITFALAVSGAVAFWVGPTYIAVSALVLMVCLILLVEAASQHSAVVKIPVSLSEVLHIIATSLVFGTIWPAIPLIFTWRRDDERDDE